MGVGLSVDTPLCPSCGAFGVPAASLPEGAAPCREDGL